MSTDKVSTLVIEVDLQCDKCKKKIQKVLFKLQKKESINRTDYDNKKNTVTISGPFDPDKLYKKIKCKACHTIKDIKIIKQEEKKPEVKKPEEKKAEEKKPEEKKPAEVKKPVEEKKPEEKKEMPKEEKKPAEEKKEKKPEEKKPEEKKEKSKEEAKAPAAAPPPWSSTTTVNLQFMNICSLCYPWPCCDPTHWGLHQPQQPAQPQPPQPQPLPELQWSPKPEPQPLPMPTQPQWPTCEGMMPTTPGRGHHQHPVPWGKWSPCGGPSYCGGCGSCHGGAGGMHGWPVMPPSHQPMCCPGPSLCRGCNGCKIVHESKFSYEEYPSSACSIM